MNDAPFQDLLASCESALTAAKRSLTIARALAEGCRSGVRPPEDVVEAYLACADRDDRQLAELREKVEALKGRLQLI